MDHTQSTTVVRVPVTAICLGCGYSLRGLPIPLCPECGQGFDPEDSWTFFDTRTPWREQIWRRRAEPPPHWHSALMILVTVAYLVICGATAWPIGLRRFGRSTWNGVGFTDGLVLLLPLLVGLGLSYLVRRHAIRITGRDHAPGQRDWLRRRRRRWTVTPICLAIMVSAIAFPWPTVVGFQVVRPLLESKEAQLQVVAGTAPGRCPKDMLLVWRVVLLDDGRLKVSARNWIGFVHDPAPRRPLSPSYVLPLGGGWYAKDWRP